jgi:Reverse transcriptase (RNA-dependent DNA polymerase)
MVGTRSQAAITPIEHVLTVVLAYPADHIVRQALTFFGIASMEDLLLFSSEADYYLPFSRPDPTDPTIQVDSKLPPVHAKRLAAIVSWSLLQADLSDPDTWLSLTPDEFRTWQLDQLRPPASSGISVSSVPTTITSSTTSTVPSFRQHIKIQLSDYPKLKEDKGWRTYNRHLLATAANHDTLDVLDPSYIPPSNLVVIFEQKQRFMFNVFSHCLHTAKGKVCLRRHDSTHDAQRVYVDLVAAYQDDLSSQLAASTLRNELTTLRLDEKWRSGYEQFLTSWTSKVLELEAIEDHPVPDDTKRIWLTNTLMSHTAMTAAVRQATTTELTMSSITTNAPSRMSWLHFYSILISTAKMLDKSRAEQSSTQRQTHQTNRSGRNNSSRNHQSGRSSNFSQKPKAFTKYTGPNMTITADMIFSKADYFKLSDSQKTKLRTLKAQAKAPNTSSTNTSINRSSVSTPSDSAPTSTTPPADHSIRSVLSSNSSKSLSWKTPVASAASSDSSPPTQIMHLGRTYTLNTFSVSYKVSQHVHIPPPTGSLVDGGANGGLSGSDVRVLMSSLHTADVTGIGDATMTSLPLCTVAGLITTHKGPIIGIFHQYAHVGTGYSIHSSNQLRQFGIVVDDNPRCFSANGQTIRTPEGHFIPLSLRNGLPYMDMSPPTDNDMATYPHVTFTSDMPWDPHVLDDEYPVDQLPDTSDDTPSYRPDSLNDYGEIIEYQLHTRHIHPCIMVCKTYVSSHPFNPQQLQPNFGFVPVERIRHTLDHTTQLARLDTRLPLRKHFKSRFPAANVSRLNETYATDTFFSDTPALDDGIYGHGGATMTQIFCGCSSQFTAGYPMKTDGEMASTLEDFIRTYGAPKSLFSDNAKAQIGKAVHDILRMYSIGNFQCEPHHQHQNPAERRIQELKRISTTIMERTNTPPSLWLLALNYTMYLLNRLSVKSLSWKTPIEMAFGQQPDVSALIAFRWYEPVYYRQPTSKYPSTSKERLGRIVGVAEHHGDALTFLVLDDITQQVKMRSELRSALTTDHPNFHAENLTPDGGEHSLLPNKPILSSTDFLGREIDPSELNLPKFTPEELIGKTFIRELDDNHSYRAKIVQRIITRDKQGQEAISFLVKLGENEFDEIMAYNEISAIIEEQHERENDDPEAKHTFASIEGHQGPLKSGDPAYQGSKYNVLVAWDDGSQTYLPIHIMIKDDPLSLVKYAEENNLLHLPGWGRVRLLSKNTARLNRMVNQSKSKRSSGPKFQFGIQVPRNVKEAIALDQKNGNNKWQDAMKEEIDSLMKFDTFIDKGNLSYLSDYKRIIVHFVFAVKHDLRHKARLVAGGHLTDAIDEGAYSSVVQLRTIRIALLAGELNNLDVMVGDVSSAYLEAFTKEKVYFIAGPEFGPLANHLLVIDKALYGLRTSGARWHDRFSDTLRDMQFFPCKADPDLWIKDCNTHYEYVCVYVDDLMMIGKDPSSFFSALTDTYGYKLKGVGKPTYHLGGDFFRDPDGTLVWGATSYIKKMLINYETMFGFKPKECSSPMEEKYHPELDLTPELDENGIRQYQSLIGALQWLITLGRFDIQCGVTAMGSYRVAPRQGHLDALKRIYGYLKRNPSGAIRFRTRIPSHHIHTQPTVFDWSASVYGTNPEEIPPDMPTPKGKAVRTTTYNDANLMHDLVTGRSMSGIIHLLNQTPIQWFSKKQNVVECATYGSEFMAARQATEQILDIRYTLRMMGIPLDGPSWLFGDNQSVITSSTIPHSTLNKRHNALSYHRVREAIASGVIYFIHISGTNNPSDILTKFLPYHKFWPLILPLLFWRGDTLSKVSPDDPIPIAIDAARQGSSLSGLRGVTDLNTLLYRSTVIPTSSDIITASNGDSLAGFGESLAAPAAVT